MFTHLAQAQRSNAYLETAPDGSDWGEDVHFPYRTQRIIRAAIEDTEAVIHQLESHWPEGISYRPNEGPSGRYRIRHASATRRQPVLDGMFLDGENALSLENRDVLLDFFRRQLTQLEADAGYFNERLERRDLLLKQRK